jgi:epoxyqueuosine reductase
VSELTRSELTSQIRIAADEIGFDLIGFAPAVTATGFADFQQWLNRGYAGQMGWMSAREDAYQHPSGVMPGVRSIVMLGLNYLTDEPLAPTVGSGRVSRYAWNDNDYHDLVRARLRQLANAVRAIQPDCRTRGVVDTAPLLERDFASLAGIGWQGKNTLLINKKLGSWLFLAALLVDVELEYDEPHLASHCGTCTRCLDECPTEAFPKPGVLDARRCIAYLNIELRDRPIPAELRHGVGDWLFGCDVCQDVCPWNHKAPPGHDEFRPSSGMNPADCRALLQMGESQFKSQFGKTPLERPGRVGILRNAAIVLGNQRDVASIPLLGDCLHDESSLIRGAAAWALGQMEHPDAILALQGRVDGEADSIVREEIASALQNL